MKNNYLTFISDIHLGKSKYMDISVIVKALKLAIDYAAKSRFKTLFVGGDLFDKSLFSAHEIDACAEFAEYGREEGVQILLPPGNHDFDYENRSALQHLNIYKQQHIVTPKQNKILTTKIDYMLAVVMPWGMDPEEAVIAFKKHGSTFPILLSHADVVSARYDNDFISKSGWSKTDVHTLANQFSIVALGHIHLPQYVHSSKRVFYIGAPIQFNYRAVGQLDRGIVLIDPQVAELKRIPLVGGEWPIFQKFNVDDSDELEKIKIEDGAIVNVVINGNNLTKETVEKHCHDVGASRVEIELRAIKQKIERRSNIEVNDTPRAIGQKIVRMKIKDKSQRPEYLEVHEEILKEAGIS